MNSLQNILPRKTLFSPQMSSVWLAVLLCLSFAVSELHFVSLTFFAPVYSHSAYLQLPPIFTSMLFLSIVAACLLVRYWPENADINLARRKMAFILDRDDSLTEQQVRVETRPTTG